MKQFKALDFVLQIILIPVCAIGALINPDSIFLAYGIVGGWQVLSAIIHLLLLNSYTPHFARKYYGLIVLALILGSFFFVPSKDGIYYGLMMLIVSPFLAIWYAYVCYAENKSFKEIIPKSDNTNEK